MRKLTSALAALIIFGVAVTTHAQANIPQAALGFPGNQPTDTSKLPRFDLDFQGGTPQALVDEIRKQTGVLNAIIPVEHANAQLPPLRMQKVNVSELFMALSAASSASASHVAVPYGGGFEQHMTGFRNTTPSFHTSYGFRSHGPTTPETVWHFYYSSTKPVDTKAYRFYQLAPYLESLTVEDITTAIQAGWRMMGETNTPELNYHKETKLLIAVGKQDHLSMINAVLAELPKGPTNSQRTLFDATRQGTNAPATPSK